MDRLTPSGLLQPVRRSSSFRPGRSSIRRTMRRVACAAALLAAPLASPALAQDPAPAPSLPSAPTVPAAGGHSSLRDRFAAADTNHDGRLTLAEAQAAGLHGVVRDFDAIDATHQGFVTLDQIRAFHRARRAKAASAAAPADDQSKPETNGDLR